MKTMIFHTAASREIYDSAAWYEALQPGLGERFQADILRTCERIRDNPLLFAEDEQGDRIAQLESFQHGIVFQVDTDVIWVAAISHHKRRPGYWRNRKPQ